MYTMIRQRVNEDQGLYIEVQGKMNILTIDCLTSKQRWNTSLSFKPSDWQFYGKTNIWVFNLSIKIELKELNWIILFATDITFVNVIFINKLYDFKLLLQWFKLFVHVLLYKQKPSFIKYTFYNHLGIAEGP